MKILVSGLINIETNVAVGNFPLDYSPIEYAFNKVSMDISGVAYNVMKALHCLGDQVLPVSIVGKDIFGDFIRENLAKFAFSTDKVFAELDSTCTSVVMFDEGGRRKVYCDLKDIQERTVSVKNVEDDARSCDGMVVCNINFNDELIRCARKFGKPVFTDVHVLSDIHDSYNKRFLENADLVFLSDECLPCQPEDFLLSIYKEYRNKAIVLGQGAKGALLFDGERSGRFTKAFVMRAVKGDFKGHKYTHLLYLCLRRGGSDQRSGREGVLAAQLQAGFPPFSLHFLSFRQSCPVFCGPGSFLSWRR